NYISRTMIKNFALVSETFYVSENASRLARAFFEIVLRRGWAQTTIACLNMSKCIQRRVWYNHQSPLRQLMDADLLKEQTVQRVEGSRLDFFQLWDLQPKELGNMFGGDGQKLYDAIRLLPCVDAEAIIKPITATIIQIEATVTPIFYWNDRVLGAGGLQRFWVFIEDLDDNMILHYEQLLLPKKKVVAEEPHKLVFTIPIHDRQIQHQYQLRVASDSYVVDDTIVSISLHNCPLPTSIRPHTGRRKASLEVVTCPCLDLLPLDPLPLRALNNPKYERLYNFEFFNPVQTQVFFCLYHTDQNTLIGAPTSSGKTLCAELAIFRVLNEKPGKK
ncbi:Type III restriction enzymeres subunit family protein, partial [Aphelenchoides avenae]